MKKPIRTENLWLKNDTELPRKIRMCIMKCLLIFCLFFLIGVPNAHAQAPAETVETPGISAELEKLSDGALRFRAIAKKDSGIQKLEIFKSVMDWDVFFLSDPSGKLPSFQAEDKESWNKSVLCSQVNIGPGKPIIQEFDFGRPNWVFKPVQLPELKAVSGDYFEELPSGTYRVQMNFKWTDPASRKGLQVKTGAIPVTVVKGQTIPHPKVKRR